MEAGISYNRLRDLTYSDAMLIGRSLVLLACIQSLVRLAGLRRTLVWADQLAKQRMARQALNLQHMTRLISACCRRWPFGTTCLERSIVGLVLLGQHGFPVSLCIGFRREEASVSGHAWIEHDSKPIAEAPLDVTGPYPGQALLSQTHRESGAAVSGSINKRRQEPRSTR